MNMKQYELTTYQVSLPTASIEELKGGGPDVNMVIITDVLNGREVVVRIPLLSTPERPFSPAGRLIA